MCNVDVSLSIKTGLIINGQTSNMLCGVFDKIRFNDEKLSKGSYMNENHEAISATPPIFERTRYRHVLIAINSFVPSGHRARRFGSSRNAL